MRADTAHRDQLERVEVAVRTAARAAERLLDAQAGGAYAVRDVDDAGEFLKLPEERLGDERGVARAGRMAADRNCGGEQEERTGTDEEAYSSGHEGWLSHIQNRLRVQVEDAAVQGPRVCEGASGEVTGAAEVVH